jgi:fructoselysine-6-P-deglycase FrlB-like protein
MSLFDQEVASQPDCWRRAARLAGHVSSQLPGHGDRVAAVGCGTSFYVAQAYALWREAAGAGESDAFAASEWPVGRRYDAVLAFCRSGTTTEVVRCLRGIGDATRRIVVTAVDAGPVYDVADATIALPFADEESLVQTRFATSALALARASLGVDVETLARAAQATLDAPGPVDPAGFDQFVFLGESAGAALAQEAALKVREATGAWSEAYPAMEYRHGPISVATATSLVWAIGPVDERLGDEIRATGATYLDLRRDPLVELTAVHRFTGLLAAARHRDVDNPPHLNRSVILV